MAQPFNPSGRNSNVKPDKWRELRDQFAHLFGQETNGGGPHIHVSTVKGDGVRNWIVSGKDSYRVSQFEALAANAACLWGNPPSGTEPCDVWLELLCLDLFERRKKNRGSNNLRFARIPGDHCIIEQVCHESAIYCSRLEAEAYAPKPLAAATAPQKRQPQSRADKMKITFQRDEKIKSEGHCLRKKGKSIADAAREIKTNPDFANVSEGRLKRLIGGELK